MKLLLAGAGKNARELLRRLGEGWSVTLVDVDSDQAASHKAAFAQVSRIVSGDASSRVTLQEAGLAAQDFVVALTNRDEVNLEVCRLARDAGVNNVAAMVNDSTFLPEFEKIHVRAVCGSFLVARQVELFLESPRLFVTTIAKGAGEVMELEVLKNAPAVGRPLREFGAKDWLVAAIHRGGELVIPHGDTVIQAKDSLTVVGRSELYRAIAHLFTLEDPAFPLEYGQDILLLVEKAEAQELIAMGREGLYVVQNTRAQRLRLLALEDGVRLVRSIAKDLEGLTEVEAVVSSDPVEEKLVQMTHGESVGCVVSAPKPLGFLANFLGIPTGIALAHRLACPLLVSRLTYPYRRILVPYSMTESTGLALETAVDLAEQLQATVDVVTVVDPLVNKGVGGRRWAEEALAQARRIGQMHHLALGEILAEGNPVREISALTRDYNLLILGSTTRSASLLRPHVGEQLLQKASCSTLVVT